MREQGHGVREAQTPRPPLAPLSKRLTEWWQDYRWYVIGAMWLVTLVTGYLGFAAYYREAGRHYSFLQLLYLALQLFVLESGWLSGPVNWAVDASRVLAPAVAACTGYAAAEGLLLAFSRQWQTLWLRRWKGHVVVCGAGYHGSRLATAFAKAGYRVVVVEKKADDAVLSALRENKIGVLLGDASRPETLRKTGILQATYLFATTGDDGLNAEIAFRAKELSRHRRAGALTCFVSIADLDMCELLREKEFAMEYHEKFRLEFFNIVQRGARALLDNYSPYGSRPQPGQDVPHMLVIGLGSLGESLVVHAANGWHSPRPLRVTVVDLKATSLGEALLAKHPELRHILDVKWVDMDVQQAEFWRGEFLSNEEAGCGITIAYVCLPDDTLALSAALILHRQCRARGTRTRIVVRIGEQSELARLLSGPPSEEREFGNIQAVHLVDEACRTDLLTEGLYESLAQRLHEVYLQEQIQQGHRIGERPALQPWEQLPEDLKESNRSQAHRLTWILRQRRYRIVPQEQAVGPLEAFPTEDVEDMAISEHELWCRERKSRGWRYGAKRNDRRKIHPDLVAWDELNEQSKETCRTTIRNMPGLLQDMGFAVERISTY